PLDETLRIIRQVVDALEAAHERGIIHRDLKPANIKLAPDGKVKVLDFGLAKASGEADSDLSNSPTKLSGSLARIVFGTSAYMSPWQAKYNDVDRSTDICAFGCVLYEMLTARQVFEAETSTDIIAKIVAGQPIWDLLPQETPTSIRILLKTVLNKEPKDR